MRTHLRESMLALLLIGILATGCDTGTDSGLGDKAFKDSQRKPETGRFHEGYTDLFPGTDWTD